MKPTIFAFTALRIAPLGLLCFDGVVHAAPKKPGLQVTTTAATSTHGPVVKFEGKLGFGYTAYAVTDDTTFDLTGITSDPRDDHPVATVFTAGEQPKPPTNLRIVGGVIHGKIPLEWSWTLTHAFGGSAFLTCANGLQSLEGVRIHNMQDGWRPRETPDFLPRAYPNTGRFRMRDCYVTGIRDDVIENDEFLPGDVEDSLFDGVFTFFSEQNEQINGVRTLALPTIGPKEDPQIRLTRVLVRLAITSAGEPGPGAWFKLHGYDSPNHQMVITDSVFAVDKQPRNGWKLVNFPKETIFKGKNHLLWLGTPGAYGANIPKGVTFLEGQRAKGKWHELRNAWLAAHGYELRSPEDWNPMEAPVVARSRLHDAKTSNPPPSP